MGAGQVGVRSISGGRSRPGAAEIDESRRDGGQRQNRQRHPHHGGEAPAAVAGGDFEHPDHLVEQDGEPAANRQPNRTETQLRVCRPAKM